MKIGLIDVDSHNFPNLALMKISAFHKSKGDHVEFINFWDSYDQVYISKVFSFSSEPQECIQSDSVVKGGTGFDLDNYLSDDIERLCPDYSLYPQYKYAIGFLSRGCSRNCPFCIVTKKEGSSHKVADLQDFYRGQKEIKLLDPNILECKERNYLLDQLIDSRAYVDFTQGIDIRLVDEEVIHKLKKMKIKIIHFAYDIPGNGLIEKKLTFFKNNVSWHRSKLSVYILTNYNTTISEDLERIAFVKSLGFTPYVMIYEKEKLPTNSFYLQMQRWANPRIFWSCSLSEYINNYKKTHPNYIRSLVKNHGSEILKYI